MSAKHWISDHKEDIARYKIFQSLYLFFSLLKYVYFRFWKSDFYASHSVMLKYERIAVSVHDWKLSPLVSRINSGLVSFIKKDIGKYRLVDSYALSLEANRYREEFRAYGREYQIRLKYPRENDEPSRQGDLLLLKPYISNKEKGVLLIQYNDSFNKFVSIYNLNRVEEYYRLVLEPSTWGYRDPAILLFLNLCTDVVVQAQYLPDFQYIKSLGSNLTPLRMGAGDWIDPERFQPVPFSDKIYDIVMVASWQRIKRHELFFEAVSKCKNVVKKIALIGYSSSGRTKDHVMYEAKKYGVAERIDIYEFISRTEVSKIIGHSKLGIMLTLREGANKGVYECFFSGVPVIISDRNIGVNREHINQYTGIVARDIELDKKITYLLDNASSFSPREWALRTTGYRNSTRLLNECLKESALKNGEVWTQDIYTKKNDTNARYVFEKDRIEAEKAILHLRGMLRK
jgi:hypothetical protein